MQDALDEATESWGVKVGTLHKIEAAFLLYYELIFLLNNPNVINPFQAERVEM